MDYDLSLTWTLIIIAAALWELAWKGMALWKAARLQQSAWFVVLLVINSVGLLPIIYLLTSGSEKERNL
jgi:hypothetical protein